MANDINLTNLITGNNDNNYLEGIEIAQNRIFGYDGDDLLKGGHDDDILVGGDGNDLMKGGDGSDWFVFDRFDGFNVITDFAPDVPSETKEGTVNLDRIVLQDGLPSDIDRLIDGATEDLLAGGVVLHYDETAVMLLGVSQVDLKPEWFAVG